ncbi:MAG: hypothetical protein WAO55_16120 [Candidatus Manganitrophaceae bacterium]
MRVKNITVGIKSLKTVMDDAKEMMKRLDAGKKVSKQKPGIYFENIDTMRKIITEERVRIIHVVKKEHPSSIYALAKLLHRDPKNVSDDVNYLAQVGLLELEKTKEGREKTIPKVGYSKILVEIPV